MEGSIVLARGRYIDGVLEVENIDFPPTEDPDLGRLNFAEANTFGGPHPTSLRLSEKLKTYIDSNSGNYLIFISEFWVDSEIALNKFKTLLSGFSDYPPVACVLFGHFLSSPIDKESPKQLEEGFKKLASIVAEFSLIQEHTNFVFVPGPFDLGAPKILPRPSIPKCIMENFMKVVPGTHLATNPCRIQYCTREIVAFRDNMISKLCRNTLKYPNKPDEEKEEAGEKVYEAFAKSIIRQSHLAPLLFSVSPVYWKHDQALQLYPIPDLVVVADDFQAYTTEYSGCKVINPGPFVKGNFSFTLYVPGEENKVEESNLPEDDS
ncbi:hypothetical protein TKK_0009584 [Trichogramma kaykai]|uniref:DNA polymerase II subunit 2 n=1 Tax=Trichogramma kaykai TaxID=54128 RepID=A0ABD2WZL1_9HYME